MSKNVNLATFIGYSWHYAFVEAIQTASCEKKSGYKFTLKYNGFLFSFRLQQKCNNKTKIFSFPVEIVIGQKSTRLHQNLLNHRHLCQTSWRRPHHHSNLKNLFRIP